MKYDYFVSSRWRNKDKVVPFIENLRAKSFKVYSFFENKHAQSYVNEDPHEAMLRLESVSNWKNDGLHQGLFKTDIDGLSNSKIFIMLLPAGKSCHIEAGVAFGLKKQCILIGKVDQAETSYQIFDKHYLSIDEFLSNLP